MQNVHFISFNSDKNSPCCQSCAYMPASVKCRDAQYATCEQESRCTGASSECPRSPAMMDGTSCLERGQCRGGKCVPYCETQNLQSCMCDTSMYFILISYLNFLLIGTINSRRILSRLCIIFSYHIQEKN